MKKNKYLVLLIVSVLMLSVIGCSENSVDTNTETNISETTENNISKTEDNEEITLTDTESQDNFQKAMESGMIQPASTIYLPSYELDDMIALEVKKAPDDSELGNFKIDELSNAIDNSKELVENYIEKINNIAEKGEVKKFDTDKEVSYEFMLYFNVLYEDTQATYYDGQNSLNVKIFEDDSMKIVCEEQEKEWYYK